jgi:hypothetical protein
MLKNKYTRIYGQIIIRAESRMLTGYKEKHHIIPQSLSGTNDKSNLVELTAREHFICHWLLTKMTTGDDRAKMVYALRMMSVTNDQQQRYTTQITARVYETYRKEHAANHSRIMTGKPAWNKGKKLEGIELERSRERTKNRKPQSVETRASVIERLIKRRTGTHQSDETKAKISASATGKIKGPQSDLHRLAISTGGKGISKSAGHGANVAKATLGNISINKDGAEKKVKQDMLDTWLADGWQVGGRKRTRT